MRKTVAPSKHLRLFFCSSSATQEFLVSFKTTSKYAKDLFFLFIYNLISSVSFEVLNSLLLSPLYLLKHPRLENPDLQQLYFKTVAFFAHNLTDSSIV